MRLLSLATVASFLCGTLAVAQPASIKASRHAPAAAPPIIVFVDRMDPSNWVAREVVLPNSRGRGRVTPRQGLARCTPLTSTCLRACRLRAARNRSGSGLRVRPKQSDRARRRY